MKFSISFCLFLVPFFLTSQTLDETISYIWTNLSNDNSHYEDYDVAGSTSLTFYRSPAFFTCEETISFNKADFTYEYVPMDNSSDDALERFGVGVNINNYGGNAYWIYSDSKKYSIRDNLEFCMPRLVVHDASTARRITKAMNHLATLLDDPFDD